ncbi:GNAT family N-acetyltransferase [Alkaliphilus serpentinus]|nr:GNAT family protein [Alkaliphilus serpentinus]
MKIYEVGDLIIIRNTKEDELDYVVEAEKKPENAQFVLQWTKEQHREALDQGDILHLIIAEKASDQPVGYIILAGITGYSRSIDFKRIVITDKGKGFGRQAVSLIKKIAFKRLNAHRLWLDVVSNNHRARNLYKSEGFTEEGLMRECILMNGGYQSMVLMSILEDEHLEA